MDNTIASSNNDNAQRELRECIDWNKSYVKKFYYPFVDEMLFLCIHRKRMDLIETYYREARKVYDKYSGLCLTASTIQEAESFPLKALYDDLNTIHTSFIREIGET